MSRSAQARGGVGTVARPSDQDEICPVCKSSRYLNQSMTFLVNPECYHKMCESCVDRIFSHGPNKCPIAGCNRTLRKHRFRKQTFEDIQVEREVDIRKRVATIFNRREDEFATLLDYNNYLNDVEDITFNLINRIDIDETETKLASYAAQNAKVISHNAGVASQEAQDFSAIQAAEREQGRLRRDAARRQEEEERRYKREGRQNMLNKLAAGVDVKEIEQEDHKVHLKRRMDRTEQVERQRQLVDADVKPSNGTSGFTIKGLKMRKPPEAVKPFDPFGGYSFIPKHYHVQDRYEWAWLNDIRDNVAIRAGGYDIQEFHSHALCEAFSGLGVFVSDESRDTVLGGDSFDQAAVSTEAAAQVASE